MDRRTLRGSHLRLGIRAMSPKGTSPGEGLEVGAGS